MIPVYISISFPKCYLESQNFLLELVKVIKVIEDIF